MIIRLRRETINWWWFLLTCGILVPGVEYLVTGFPSAYFFSYKYFITGINPFLFSVFGVFVYFIFTAVFKLLLRIKVRDAANRVLYILAGVVFIYIFADKFFLGIRTLQSSGNNFVVFNVPLSGKRTSESWYYFFEIIIVLIFLTFFVINFPRQTHKKATK